MDGELISQPINKSPQVQKYNLISLLLPVLGAIIGALISFLVNIFVGIIIGGALMILLIIIFWKKYGLGKANRRIATIIFIIASLVCIGYSILLIISPISRESVLGTWFITFDGGTTCTNSDQCQAKRCIKFGFEPEFHCAKYYIAPRMMEEITIEENNALQQHFKSF